MTERDFTGGSFVKFLDEHRLMASRCRSCGALNLPPRQICPECHAEDGEWVEVSGNGKLVTFTIVHIAPSVMINAGYGRENPYCSGIVELEEGPSISALILGIDTGKPEDIAIGSPVKVEYLEHGEGEAHCTVLAFRVG